MLVLRLLLVIGVIAVAVSMAVYLLSGDKRYLRFSWQLIKFTGVLLFVAAVIMAMGRIILF
ncbi:MULTISPECIES: hypothetical protein [Methylovorus]|jgi:hypothetical protein|uniref:Transmembrane protein n=1 Tax=Methylovorus glucosotrophus (strain SIP3-4) TaxID=582744 RepID=C6X996_METGS|nr:MULTISPECIES: hypothetical protein [Methylovorus]HWU35339.1 hypothetical protein [Methylovorus sp.]ACT49716.1 conserved hypothetical protein [Methylovorus glucosotrophus SIP3-4]ADQ83672.1 conserved hypothetical protein [Methylovorus sp. MP688]KAF0836328.1 hypothetical protein FNL37_2637 [Methylovorus glucosotrophus]MCB4810362.1 hypothetical protein [Methylovorus menthalis]